MNRRDFFRLSAGILAAPLAAYLPAAAPEATAGFISIDAVRRASDLLQAQHVPGPYTVIAHPDAARDLARMKWNRAYRKARLDLKKMAQGFNGQIGRIDGFRFIVSEHA